jgi:hypothetical protein
VDGSTGAESKQTKMALEEFRRDQTVAAFFGFSGGGYNVRHILDKLTPDERSRVHLVVVLGAPKNSADVYLASKYGEKAKWELVYKTNPPKSAPFVPKAHVRPGVAARRAQTERKRTSRPLLADAHAQASLTRCRSRSGCSGIWTIPKGMTGAMVPRGKAHDIATPPQLAQRRPVARSAWKAVRHR